MRRLFCCPLPRLGRFSGRIVGARGLNGHLGHNEASGVGGDSRGKQFPPHTGPSPPILVAHCKDQAALIGFLRFIQPMMDPPGRIVRRGGICPISQRISRLMVKLVRPPQFSNPTDAVISVCQPGYLRSPTLPTSKRSMPRSGSSLMWLALAQESTYL